MRNIRKYNQEKATVCASNTCITVHGEAAQFINVVAIVTTLVGAVILIDKALR